MISRGESRHKPNESKPGPKFAMVAGEETVTRSYIRGHTWLTSG